jgi:hypothetical protein
MWRKLLGSWQRDALVVIAVTSLIGCADETSPTPFEAPSFALDENGSGMVALSAVTQSGTPGAFVADAPRVRVLHRNNPVANTAVRFEVTAGGGSVSERIVYTDAQGVAQSGWRLGPEPGLNSLRASAGRRNVVDFQATSSTGPAEGTLATTITGLAGDATAGGTLNVQSTDGSGEPPHNVTIGGNGVASLALPAGAYRVSYTPPPDYSLAAGDSASRNVSITSGQTTSIGYRVAETPAAEGTLNVHVTGVSAGAPNAGSVSILRTDAGNDPPRTATVPSSGSYSVALAPGTYSVTYTAPSGYELASGQQNPRSTSITAGQTSAVSFTVQPVAPPPPPPPPGGGLVFHSDFSTALGMSDAAWRDTNKPQPWDAIGGNGRSNEVIRSTGLDFPTTNVLKVVAGYRSGGGAASQSPRLPYQNGRIPIPAVGGSLYYRWYLRMVTPDSYMSDYATHPIQDGVAGSETNWLFRIENRPNGTWNARFDVDATSANAHPNTHFGSNIVLNKGVTYRFELQIHRTGTSTFQMHARIYNSSGVLLYDDDDFRNANGSGSLANRPTLQFNQISRLAGFQIGFNGLNVGGPELFPFTLTYQSGICIRTDTWCGPYSGGI